MRIALLCALVGLACPAAGKKTEKVDVTAKSYQLHLPRGFVTLHDLYGGLHRLSVELATNDAARERGLMWRTKLADGEGMLFIFPDSEHHTFWMKNTLIPLDMIFIGEDDKVVGVVQNAEPRSLDPREVDGLSRYVLEVPAGWSQKAGIGPGSAVEIEGASMLPIE